METSSFPSVSQLQCKQSSSHLPWEQRCKQRNGLINRDFSLTHWCWTKCDRSRSSCRGWSGLLVSSSCPCRALDLLQQPLHTTYSESTCAETNISIFDVKSAQARFKEEHFKKTIQHKLKMLIRQVVVYTVSDGCCTSSVKPKICGLSWLHQHLAVFFTHSRKMSVCILETD